MKFFRGGLLCFLVIGILVAVAAGFPTDNPRHRDDVQCRGGGRSGGYGRGGGYGGGYGGGRGRGSTAAPPTGGDAEDIPGAGGVDEIDI